MIKRDYFKLIENELNYEEITILIGTRRVGKTTIMEELFNNLPKSKKSIFLTFDNIEVLNLFESNEELFKEQYVNPFDIIFIDEIQYSKQSGRILKYLFDTTKKKFIISGSSIPELSINSISYLVGRVRIFNIYPLKFIEFLNYKSSNKAILFNTLRDIKDFNQIKNQFEEYLKYGSYPKIIISKLLDKEKFLKDLTNIYLLKEVKDILEYKNIFKFEKFIKHLALIDGGLINKTSISQEIEIDRISIFQMIKILKDTFILYEVKPYLKNKLKEEIRTSKIYFQDLGFKNSLINNFSNLDNRLDKGNILESFILNSLVREGFQVKFWNYKNRYEMDFIIEKNGKVIGIECKSRIIKPILTKSNMAFMKTFSPYRIFIINQSIDKTLKIENTQINFINYFNFIGLIINSKLFVKKII
jgi:predicted AAA+ superfamily ATPase